MADQLHWNLAKCSWNNIQCDESVDSSSTELREHVQDKQPTSDCCSQDWSKIKHMKQVDVALNFVLQTITGCLQPMPKQYLPVLACVAPVSV